MALLLAVSTSFSSGCARTSYSYWPISGSVDFEFHRQFLELLRIDLFGLDDLALPQQLHGDVLQFAADQPQRGVDARLLFHVTIGLITGDAHGDVAHLALLAERDGVNRRLAIVRGAGRF